MGLISKITCGIMVLGAFQLGRMVSNPTPAKKDVLRYIDLNKNDRKEIYLYTQNYLSQTDSLFLDSLINNEQKKEYARDYLNNPDNFFDINSERIIKDIKILSDKTKRAYQELMK